jgi:multidrug efflux pump subunit AcrA (membrane-fusion protein)
MPEELEPTTPQTETTAAPTEDSAPAYVTKDDLARITAELNEKLNRDINGFAAKIKGQLGGVEQQNQSIQALLQKLATPPSDTDEAALPPAEDEATPQSLQPQEGDSNFQAIQKQIERERRARLSQSKELEAMKAKLEQAEKQAQRMRATQTFAAVAGDRVIDPDGLLTLAESKGLIIQRDDQFMVAMGEDQYTGETVYKPVTEALDSVIDKFPYLKKARPGNGTGATPSAPATPPKEMTGDEMALEAARRRGLV